MGEEKPDEELMGKRKSSPRLSTTFIDVDISRMPGCGRNIPDFEKKWRDVCFVFHIWDDCVTIITVNDVVLAMNL